MKSRTPLRERRRRYAEACRMDTLAREAIEKLGRECFDCLRLAATDEAASIGDGVPAGLRKLAAYHVERAWEWVPHVMTREAAANA